MEEPMEENSVEKEQAKQSLIRGEVTDDVNRKLLELSALFEISQLLNSSLNLTAIVDNILLSPMGRMMINKGLFLLHRGGHQFEVFTLKGLSRDLIGKSIMISDLPERPFLMDEIKDTGVSWVTFFETFDMRLFIPILLRNDILGVVAYGKKLVGGPFQSSEVEFLSSIASIAATSIQNGLVFDELKNVNSRLDKKIQELNTLFDIGKELNASLEVKKIVKLLGYGLMGEMMANKYMIILCRQEKYDVQEKRGFAGLELGPAQWQTLFGTVQPYALDDCDYSDLNRHLSNCEVTAVVPMRSQEKTKGLLLLGNKISGKGYSKDDLNFVFTLGNQAMISLENAWLFEDSLEKKRLEKELQLARRIQEKLLPATFPSLKSFEVFGLNIPSKQVGGDYFDIIKVDDSHYIVAIADVSGKGVPASLLMSNLQASLMALSTERKAFDKIVSRINDIIHANTGSDKFITFFGGVLDLNTREFCYVNAGHNPPYWIKVDGQLTTLDKGGLLLGLMPGLLYESGTILLQPGERIVMFTDGVTEAMNESGELYDESRLEVLLQSVRGESARNVTDRISDAVKAFAGTAQQSDDITIVVLGAHP